MAVTTGPFEPFIYDSIIKPSKGASVSDFGQMIIGVNKVNVEAAEGGKVNNIPPSRFYIPALADVSGNLVYAQSDDAFTGGDDKNAKVATKEDIEGAKQKAQDEIGKKIEAEYSIKGEKVFVKGLSTKEDISEEADKKEGEEADLDGFP